jgi:hypothetical protein
MLLLRRRWLLLLLLSFLLCGFVRLLLLPLLVLMSCQRLWQC